MKQIWSGCYLATAGKLTYCEYKLSTGHSHHSRVMTQSELGAEGTVDMAARRPYLGVTGNVVSQF